MTPTEVLDTYESQLKNKPNEKETFTRDEVKSMINICFSAFRNAILYGTFDLTIENKKGEIVTVSDKDYKVFKFAGKDGKQFLIMQFTSDDGNGPTAVELDGISNEISKALKKTKGIGGVLLLPTNCETQMLTARMSIPAINEQPLPFAFDDSGDNVLAYDDIMSIITSMRDDGIAKLSGEDENEE